MMKVSFATLAKQGSVSEERGEDLEGKGRFGELTGLIGMASPLPFSVQVAACPENLFFLPPRQAGPHPAAFSICWA